MTVEGTDSVFLDEAGATLDRGVLVALQQVEKSGQPGLLMRVVTLFLHETPARLAELQEAIVQGDAERVEEVAHGLKGSAAQLGATRMAGLSAGLQAAGAHRDLGGAAAQVADLQREFVLVRAALEAIVSTARTA
ncbi:MAG TPA: Hpt domain-containing protein [Chloroflexota bacterium]|jgi:HPt (histidine-containing phosphotransfer) domain-containing protein|nr:Hpt domain-containing protein [Chloroflexota bacterium]